MGAFVDKPRDNIRIAGIRYDGAPLKLYIADLVFLESRTRSISCELSDAQLERMKALASLVKSDESRITNPDFHKSRVWIKVDPIHPMQYTDAEGSVSLNIDHLPIVKKGDACHVTARPYLIRTGYYQHYMVFETRGLSFVKASGRCLLDRPRCAPSRMTRPDIFNPYPFVTPAASVHVIRTNKDAPNGIGDSRVPQRAGSVHPRFAEGDLCRDQRFHSPVFLHESHRNGTRFSPG